MQDINYQLRTAYVGVLYPHVLLQSTVVPVYYQQTPTGTNPDTFILIQSIYSTGFNDMDTNYLKTNVQIMVVTKRQQNNSGLDADDIAGQISTLVYPNTRSQPVQLSSVGKIITTTLLTDIIQGGLTDGEKKVLNRIITFQHQITVYS
jgi:hypothetical protein